MASTVNRQGETASTQVVRLSLLTTEPARQNDPKDPKKGNKPKIRAPQNQAIGPKQDQGLLRIAVPADVTVSEIDAVIKAELVPHAYSGQVTGTVYSYPFKLPVKTAAAVNLDKPTLNLTAGKASTIKGTVSRTAPFANPLTIALSGLPKGYQAAEAQVPRDAKNFEISITPAAETADENHQSQPVGETAERCPDPARSSGGAKSRPRLVILLFIGKLARSASKGLCFPSLALRASS